MPHSSLQHTQKIPTHTSKYYNISVSLFLCPNPAVMLTLMQLVKVNLIHQTPYAALVLLNDVLERVNLQVLVLRALNSLTVRSYRSLLL